MDKDTTTFGLNPADLAGLLGIGIAADGQTKGSLEEARAELLRARFAGPLPLTPSTVEALPTLIGRLTRELLPLAGRSLGDLLLDETTPFDIVEGIKSYGKKLAASGEPSRSIGVAVYYMAIASALVFHDKRITKHSFEHLRDSFRALDKGWMSGEMARLVSKAERLCGKRLKA